MRMTNVLRALGFFIAVAQCGCGGNDEHGGASGAGAAGHSSQHAGSGSGGGGGMGASGGEVGAGSGGDSGSPQAPNMISAKPLDGGLHVMWENVTPDCDAIEIDRKKDQGVYALAFTLTGVAEEQHDADATAPGEYCYRGRCKKGSEVSPDSNEVCGTP